jgi:hypothetical protein
VKGMGIAFGGLWTSTVWSVVWGAVGRREIG